ncbi:MAG: winged helix-turn-helix transcriptional regulator [Chloroflexota bacterium]
MQQKDYAVTVVSTGKAARKKIPQLKPDILIIDAASMRTTGTRICKSIQGVDPDLPIILINSSNYIPTNNVVADVQLVLPFTIRKLENRIIPLIPGDGEEVIKAGPIHLDIDRQTVRCRDNEEHITPRMVELMKMLIDRSGEVIQREVLFSKVWQTDYTEDTRSLDVHINWLRKAIEDDPSDPELILTVRGKGYKLDL